MNTAKPKVVSKEEWEKASAELLVREKEITRLTDQIAATRRKMPMYKVEKDYFFDTESGKKSLLELFDGRNQLIVYHFMFDPKWEKACSGCSWVVDAMSHPAHLHARGVSIVNVGRAPLKKLLEYKKTMNWGHAWASSHESDFNDDFGATKNFGEDHGVSVFLRDGKDIYQTYHSEARGVDRLGSHWTYLDLTPYGRKEAWEDSPAGWPKLGDDFYTCRHDEYTTDGREA